LASFEAFGESECQIISQRKSGCARTKKRRQINRGHRTKVRTYIKKLRSALDGGEKQQIDQMLPEVISVIDKSVQRVFCTQTQLHATNRD